MTYPWDNTATINNWEGKKYAGLRIVFNYLFYLHLTGNDDGHCIPHWLFENHTDEALDASYVDTYGGFSSVFILANFCKIDGSADIHNFTIFNNFVKILNDMHGDPGIGVCSGTIEFAGHAYWAKTHHIASIAPQYFSGSTNDKEIKNNHNYLEIWSNKGIWNKRKYKELRGSLNSVISELNEHYLKRFKVKGNTAQIYAESIVEQYIDMYTGSYSSRGTFDILKDPVYNCCTSSNLSIDSIKKLMPLKQEDLNQALKWSVLNQQPVEVIRYLIDNGADINSGAESAIILAVDKPHLLKPLIDAGGDVNYENCFGKTAIYYAIQYNELESAKTLIANGAAVNHRTLPVEVVRSWDRDIKRPECDECYNISRGNRTPLMYACWQGTVKMIQLLLDNGADPNIQDSYGDDALSYINDNNMLTKEKQNYVVGLLGKKK